MLTGNSLKVDDIELCQSNLDIDATNRNYECIACDQDMGASSDSVAPCTEASHSRSEPEVHANDAIIDDNPDLVKLDIGRGLDLAKAEARRPFRDTQRTSSSNAGRSEIRLTGRIDLDANESSISSCAASIVASSSYGYLVCLMLLLNALTIGLEVNGAAMDHSQATPFAFQFSEVCFCILFTFEVCLRIFVQRRAFFRTPALPWNMFDLCIVGLQLVELLMTAVMAICAGDGSTWTSRRDSGAVMKFARGLQLLRIIRLLRIVHIVRDLNTLVYLICASVWSFLWTVALLALLTYIVGVFITQLVVEQRREDAASVAPGTQLHQYFGSISKSVLSLYQAISGGVDWAVLVEPLSSGISPALVPFFALYVAFAVLVLLNLVTGVYVEGAQRLTKADRERELLRKARRLFIQTDDDDTGTITWGQFRSQFEGQAMTELLADMELGLCKPDDVFWLLDREGAGQIKAEEFVKGTSSLGRPARTLDLALVLREIQDLSTWLRRHFAALEEHVGHVDGKWSCYPGDMLDLQRSSLSPLR